MLQWWTMYSYPGCAQGLLTADFKPKAVDPSQILSFNSDAVLLLSGLPRSIAASPATPGISSSSSSAASIMVRLSISNYLPSPLSLSRVHWSLTDCDGSNTTLYGSGVWTANTSSATQGSITPLGDWAVPVPAVVVPMCVSLQARVDGGSCLHCSGGEPVLQNDWTFWVVPKAPPVTAVVHTDSALEQRLRQTGVFEILRPLNNTTRVLPGAGATYVVSQMTPSVQAAMEAGATVLCIKCTASTAAGLLPALLPEQAYVVAYGPGLWTTMGPGGARGVGTFMNYKTVLEPLARHTRWLDFSWFAHVEGAWVQPVGSTPAAPPADHLPLSLLSSSAAHTKVILRWLNAPCAYSGPLTVFSRSMGRNRTFSSGCQGGAKLLGASYALLSETSVGKGRLLWSGLELFPSLPPPPPPPAHPPTMGFCPAGNFSACESAVRGDFLGDYSPDHEHVELHVAATAVTVDAIWLDVQGINPKPINPTCNPHQQPVTIRAVVYSDVNGRPSKLVASTDSVTLDKSHTRSFVRLRLLHGKDVRLAPGKYWLGNHIGSVCAVMWGSPAFSGRSPCVYAQQSFVDGPAPTFPTKQYGRCSGALSVFATFTGGGALLPRRESVTGRVRVNDNRSIVADSSSTALLTPWILSLLLNQGRP